MFKTLTGGDTITAEHKFRPPFAVRPYARLIFSSNYLPRSNDASHAYFRRWTIVQFPRTFDSIDQLPREILDRDLGAPSELSGVLNRAVLALRTIRARRGLLESQSVRDAGAEFEKLTDPVAAWLDANTEKAPDAVVAKNALLEAYNEAARREERPVVTATALGSAIGRLMPTLKDAQRKIAGEQAWVWVGLRLRPRKYG
jgi:phage/plasmid-associated DNA primase